MKMVKKILLGLVATAAVFSLVGCQGIENDNAETKGKKDDKTITVNATNTDDKYDADKKYKRAFVQLGTLEQIQAVTSTLTFNKNDVKDSVVGFAFDLNFDKDLNDTDKKDSYNFVLIGFNAEKSKYYVERYKEVSLKENNGYTDEPALGKYISYVNNNWTTEYVTEYSDFVDATKGTHYSEDTDGNITLKISITQDTDKTYKIKLGNATIGEYTRTDKSNKDLTKFVNVTSAGKAQGGIAVYANAKNGSKFSVNCKTDLDSVVGKFYEEVEE